MDRRCRPPYVTRICRTRARRPKPFRLSSFPKFCSAADPPATQDRKGWPAKPPAERQPARQRASVSEPPASDSGLAPPTYQAMRSELLLAPIHPNAKDGRLKIRLEPLSHTLVLGREPMITAPGEADRPMSFNSNPPSAPHRPCGLLTRDERISRKHISITGSPPVLTHLSTSNHTVVITSTGRRVLKRPGKRVTLCCDDEIHLVNIFAAQAAGDAGFFAGYTLEPCAYRVDVVEPFLELQPIKPDGRAYLWPRLQLGGTTEIRLGREGPWAISDPRCSRQARGVRWQPRQHARRRLRSWLLARGPAASGAAGR